MQLAFVYVQQEEIRVSKDTYELLLQSEQIVVKSNILDLEDYDVKMEPKAIRSDDDNQSLNEIVSDSDPQRIDPLKASNVEH